MVLVVQQLLVLFRCLKDVTIIPGGSNDGLATFKKQFFNVLELRYYFRTVPEAALASVFC